MGAKENYITKGFTDYLSKPVKYETLELILKEYIPKEKQLSPSGVDELPVMLIWGDDPDSLKIEKDRLDGIYKCVLCHRQSRNGKVSEQTRTGRSDACGNQGHSLTHIY